MTHASVFSGIGGAEIAADMNGIENLFHCEINPFGRQILDYWYPKAESYEDITKTDFTKWRGKVDILTGGFPCQPFSYAGRRGGADDDRYLWPEMCRVIREVRPTWFIGENVVGITTMVEQGETTEMGNEATLFQTGDDVHRYRLEQTFTIERICNDLEREGYSVQTFIIPACGVGAPHRRDRVWFVARRKDGFTPDTEHNGLQHDLGRGGERKMFETQSGRGQDGLSVKVEPVTATRSGWTITDTSRQQGDGCQPQFGEHCQPGSQQFRGGDCQDGCQRTDTDTLRIGLIEGGA